MRGRRVVPVGWPHPAGTGHAIELFDVAPILYFLPVPPFSISCTCAI
jgi:hypothetical protein